VFGPHKSAPIVHSGIMLALDVRILEMFEIDRSGGRSWLLLSCVWAVCCIFLLIWAKYAATGIFGWWRSENPAGEIVWLDGSGNGHLFHFGLHLITTTVIEQEIPPDGSSNCNTKHNRKAKYAYTHEIKLQPLSRQPKDSLMSPCFDAVSPNYSWKRRDFKSAETPGCVCKTRDSRACLAQNFPNALFKLSLNLAAVVLMLACIC